MTQQNLIFTGVVREIWFGAELFVLHMEAGFLEDNSVNFRNCFLW